VLGLIRREIRKREGILVDEEDLATAIHGMLSPEAREKMGPVKIRHHRSGKTTKKLQSSESQAEDQPAAPLSPESQLVSANVDSDESAQ
jgi:hypothetical protein